MIGATYFGQTPPGASPTTSGDSSVASTPLAITAAATTSGSTGVLDDGAVSVAAASTASGVVSLAATASLAVAVSASAITGLAGSASAAVSVGTSTAGAVAAASAAVAAWTAAIATTGVVSEVATAATAATIAITTTGATSLTATASRATTVGITAAGTLATSATATVSVAADANTNGFTDVDPPAFLDLTVGTTASGATTLARAGSGLSAVAAPSATGIVFHPLAVDAQVGLSANGTVGGRIIGWGICMGTLGTYDGGTPPTDLFAYGARSIGVTTSVTGSVTAVTPPTFVRFTPGTVQPNGSLDSGTTNVGPRIADADLTVHVGDIVLASNQVVEGLDIYGQVTTATGATGAIVRDCIIRGKNAPTSQNAMAVGHSYNFGGTLFEFCRFDGRGRESMWMDCINGGNYTMRYCELMRGVDGIGANTVGNAVIECCRIYHGHYAAFWNDATNTVRSTTFTDFGGTVWSPPFVAQSSGDTHSDGCQIQGWSGWVLRGNYIGGQRGTSATGGSLDPTVHADYDIVQALDADASFTNAAIIVNAVASHPTGALIELNWLEGGAARVNLSTAGTDLLAGVTIKNNRFVRSGWGGSPGFYIYAYTNHQATLTNNVYDDTGSAVPIVLH